jgi:hypothetical protein
MKIITSKEVEEMLRSQISENLKATAGKGKNKKVVIATGFKIEHIKSGLNYTVKGVGMSKKGSLVLKAESGDGNIFIIPQNSFNQYRGR